MEDPDPNDDEDKCTVVILLLQKNRRALLDEGYDLLSIGLKLYHLKNPESLPKTLDKKFFSKTKSVKGTNPFTDRKEVTE